MSTVTDVLRDVVLEAHTASAAIEYDDPLSDSLQYIEDMSRCAIEMLGEQP